MSRHVLLAIVVVALAGFGLAGAAGAAPSKSQPGSIPLAVVVSPPAKKLSLPVGGQQAVTAVTDARAAVQALPKYVLTCEPAAAARFDNPDDPDMITNKDCLDLIAEKEAAHRAFAEQNWVDRDCIGYGCSPEQDAELNAAESAAQDEYWARCAYTAPGVDGC
ncbi:MULTISPECIES: hypothetical protein [Pseudonocardia]|uniref:Secreted protein n=2 Tax=Pseudonocardia TaxID=1847 RepID=A0A1Y2MRU2_PSEAH|nr:MULTISPECIES: hypothetical protein [Pseudonocardia]OSY37934.1 hypothetical protein BG845_04340 [Pseudonocardia autotrophica]TDN74595.1 hypothetical protein C8E95_3720 [Pseudonocardia autotrophica]BBG05365.1 hypothetical protein Pdca_65740 [Pseudonocardia autotrophica]GEC29011.1 hypothetical protein PSA01_60400 [Pseudonocardia saturnea]